jgi:ketosteroid isomerase-like protein
MSSDKVEIATRVVDAYNRRDVDCLFDELATPDFEWWPAVTRAYEGGCYRGREGVERFAADTSENWEDLQSIAEEFRDLGDRVLLLGRQVGRGKGSGAQVETPIAGIFDFRGDRVCRFRAYFDRTEGLGAAGLSE